MRWTRYILEQKRLEWALEKVDWSSLSQMFRQWVPDMKAAVREWPSAVVFHAVQCTEENPVVLEWSLRRGVTSAMVHKARLDTAVPSSVDTWTPAGTACTWRVVGRPASVDPRADIASDPGRIFVCRWWLVRAAAFMTRWPVHRLQIRPIVHN